MIEITPEIIKKCKEFGFKEGYESLLYDFVPTDSSFYHNQTTPKRFKYTSKFSEVAKYKRDTGVYCPYPKGSKKYLEFWNEQWRRCKEGFTIREEEGNYVLSITGYHYFFLNFCQIRVVWDESDEFGNKVSKWEDTSPHFWDLHYHFFWAFQECINLGKDIVILKPRATGFSEIFSSIVACNYTFYSQPNIVCADEELALIKNDGLFMKITSKLDYLNTNTEGGMQRIRSINGKLHKQSGVLTKQRERIGKGGGEVIGIAVDGNGDKVRGARCRLVGYEEGGNFRKSKETWDKSQALVVVQGHRVGIRAMWGTGGTMGAGADGITMLFNEPKINKCKVFFNKWDNQSYDSECGFFFPTYSLYSKYMDSDGNTDELKAYLYLMQERLEIAKSSDGDKFFRHCAEYPFKPSEALRKTTESIFDRNEIQQRLAEIKSKKIDKLWINGELQKTNLGIEFNYKPKLKAVNDYPIKKDKMVEYKPVISIIEKPRKIDNKVPDNLYSIVIDPYAQDESNDSVSIGACYVFRNSSNLFPLDVFNGNIVASYIGRCALDKWWENVFKLAEFYNATINFLRRGGGQSCVDHARQWKKLNLLAYNLDVFNMTGKGNKARQYGVTLTDDQYATGLEYLKKWLDEDVEVWYDEGKTVYKKRYHIINDEGLLTELYNFVYNKVGNYDRVDALILWMYVKQDYLIKNTKPKTIKEDFFDKIGINKWYQQKDL